MANGTALADADRWDWLTTLRDEAIRSLNETHTSGVVVTCSALKTKYRDVVRVAAYYHRNISVHFLYLDAKVEVLLQRVSARKGHYMGENMVQSQFEILERPTEEEMDVCFVDVSQSMAAVKKDALEGVRHALFST